MIPIEKMAPTSRPCLEASSAIDAERDMSSYEELVHDPISATFKSAGQSFFFTSSANLEMGVARSGVNGPLIWGSSSERFYPKSLAFIHSILIKDAHNLNHLIILGTLVRNQVVAESLCVFRDFRTLGGIEVVDHAAIEGEQARRSADFSTHVTDGSHASAREGFDTGSIVFDNGTCTSLDGEDTCHFKNDIYTRIK
jgi:hypothetical protein